MQHTPSFNGNELSSTLHPPRLQDSIATARLHNPSDAIGILAEVANSTEPLRQSQHESPRDARHALKFAPIVHGTVQNIAFGEAPLDYTPFRDGLVSLETVHTLLETCVVWHSIPLCKLMVTQLRN